MREEINKNIDMFSEAFSRHGEAFVVSLLLFEKESIFKSEHVNNRLVKIYSEVYQKYMKIDDMKLLHEDFDNIILDVKDELIKKAKKDVER